MSLELLLAIGVNLVGLGAVYGGIRAEMRWLAEGLKEVKLDVTLAHDRIDKIYFKLDRGNAPQ